METQSTYNYKVVRQFAVMTVVWGIVGMLVGVIIAAQLVWPDLNIGPWLHFGRLRPLHTNAVIFAFGGSALFATSYYVVQRTCQVRLISDKLAAFTFWAWQLVIVGAAISLPMGLRQRLANAEGAERQADHRRQRNEGNELITPLGPGVAQADVDRQGSEHGLIRPPPGDPPPGAGHGPSAAPG